MKKLFSLIVLVLLSNLAFAQENPVDSSVAKSDSNIVKKEKKVEIKVCEKEDDDKDFNINLGHEKGGVKTRFILVEMGVNAYHNEGELNIPANLKTYELRFGNSFEANIHLYRQRFKIGSGVFNIEHGMTYNLNQYSFENKVRYRNDVNNEEFYIDNSRDIRKSRLTISRMSIPVLLHFETNPKKLKRSFHLGVGAYASVRLGSSHVSKVSARDKEKISDNFGLNDFAFGARAELGYGPINLYMTYSFTDLFKTGQGPALTPFSVGFSIIPW